tara:strand:- start:2530 stop:2781 length:252 start_codon:yes stop_codon:yes gene_type:complete
MYSIKLPKDKKIELPNINIPIMDKNGKQLGVAVKPRIEDNKLKFGTTFKGKYSSKAYDFTFEFKPCYQGNKVEKLYLKVIYQL